LADSLLLLLLLHGLNTRQVIHCIVKNRKFILFCNCATADNKYSKDQPFV